MTENTTVTLSNLANGAALELFQSCLDKAVADIRDPNTDSEQARTIRLEVSIKPSDKRDLGDVSIKASARLAGMQGVETRFYFGRHHGHPIAVEHDPKQSRLFDGPPDVPIAATAEKGASA